MIETSISGSENKSANASREIDISGFIYLIPQDYTGSLPPFDKRIKLYFYKGWYNNDPSQGSDQNKNFVYGWSLDEQ
jgi:hypothetical protein